MQLVLLSLSYAHVSDLAHGCCCGSAKQPDRNSTEDNIFTDCHDASPPVTNDNSIKGRICTRCQYEHCRIRAIMGIRLLYAFLRPVLTLSENMKRCGPFCDCNTGDSVAHCLLCAFWITMRVTIVNVST